jgi:SAM-dependent methyltransferase
VFPRITVRTDHPVAVHSPDHLYPRGTATDSFFHLPFNAKLKTLHHDRQSSVLDLGCAGGGMVSTFLDEGTLAVGIEGSDYSKLRGRAEWATHPDFLFTADITKRFEVLADDRPAWFTTVTMWEFIEHIAEPDLPAVFDNVDRHLELRGYVIGTVNHGVDYNERAVYHQTVRPWPWWEEKFNALGWVNQPDLVEMFGHDMVRHYDTSAPFVLTR